MISLHHVLIEVKGKSLSTVLTLRFGNHWSIGCLNIGTGIGLTYKEKIEREVNSLFKGIYA